MARLHSFCILIWMMPDSKIEEPLGHGSGDVPDEPPQKRQKRGRYVSKAWCVPSFLVRMNVDAESDLVMSVRRGRSRYGDWRTWMHDVRY